MAAANDDSHSDSRSKSQAGHGHDSFTHARQQSRGRLVTVVILSSTFLVVEIVAGYYTGSLTLLADAGHMFGDVAALALALLAMWFAARPATAGKTYGYYRSEILAALINSLALIGISFFIIGEAWERLANPPHVLAGPMLIVAIGGLIVNIISMRLLTQGTSTSLNEQAAKLEVLSDLLGSVGAIAASLVMMFTKWYFIDPVLSAVVGLMILPRTWSLVTECTNILMEGTPRDINLQKMVAAFKNVEGVVDIHDLHVWTITSGRNSMSAHVTIDPAAPSSAVLEALTKVARDEFDIRHSTIQVEQANNCDAGPCHQPQ